MTLIVRDNSKATLPLNLFYDEPDPDRWFPLDRYPRKFVRRLIRGPKRPGGHTRVFLNLCAGLDKLEIPYRVNNYRYIHSHPKELACIIGKPYLLDQYSWKNPILFGASGFSHPVADLKLFERLPVRKVLVPGKWMKAMFTPFYGDRVLAWPVGIDTEKWKPTSAQEKDIDILLYNKIRWEKERYDTELVEPIRVALAHRRLRFAELRYGLYKEEDFHSLLARSKSMIFLCEHETQGIAYQQALACGVPTIAWDRGGYWQDPSYYPHKAKFSPVSSVPYWDCRCGLRFSEISEFTQILEEFLKKLYSQCFDPRSYILENLTLEKCAQQYFEIYRLIESEQSEFIAA